VEKVETHLFFVVIRERVFAFMIGVVTPPVFILIFSDRP